jgi:hypothetical protein
MGHVARHCFAAWKKPGAKKSNHANPNPVPNVLEKKYLDHPVQNLGCESSNCGWGLWKHEADFGGAIWFIQS